uniref:Uncharacterized protein n=1 Tax=Timema bartmani TaxID=61472 RepID=A0A7R9F252_9NEOP|nr:unnamed protein product [Timema bartmani]
MLALRFVLIRLLSVFGANTKPLAVFICTRFMVNVRMANGGLLDYAESHFLDFVLLKNPALPTFSFRGFLSLFIGGLLQFGIWLVGQRLFRERYNLQNGYLSSSRRTSTIYMSPSRSRMQTGSTRLAGYMTSAMDRVLQMCPDTDESSRMNGSLEDIFRDDDIKEHQINNTFEEIPYFNLSTNIMNNKPIAVRDVAVKTTSENF